MEGGDFGGVRTILVSFLMATGLSKGNLLLAGSLIRGVELGGVVTVLVTLLSPSTLLSGDFFLFWRLLRGRDSHDWSCGFKFFQDTLDLN